MLVYVICKGNQIESPRLNTTKQEKRGLSRCGREWYAFRICCGLDEVALDDETSVLRRAKAT